MVVQAIQGVPEALYWSIDCIIKYIIALFPSFCFWDASHVVREINVIAHVVAKWVLLCNSFGTIPISSILASVLEGLDDGGGSLAPGF